MIIRIKQFVFRKFFRKHYDLLQTQLQDLFEAQRSSRIISDHYSLPARFPILSNHETWLMCPGCQEIYDARGWTSCPNCNTKP